MVDYADNERDGHFQESLKADYSEKLHQHRDYWQESHMGETFSLRFGGSRDNFHSNGTKKNFGRFSYVQAFKGARGSYCRGNNVDLRQHHSFEDCLHMGSRQHRHDISRTQGQNGQHSRDSIRGWGRSGHLDHGHRDGVTSMGRYECYNNPCPGYGYVRHSWCHDNRKNFYHQAKGQSNQLNKIKRGGAFLGCFKRSSLKSTDIITPFSDAKGQDFKSAAWSNNSVLECNRDLINCTIHNTRPLPPTKRELFPLTSKFKKEQASLNCESSFLCQSEVCPAPVAKKLRDDATLPLKDITIGVKRERAFITCSNGKKRPRSSAVRDYPPKCNKHQATVNEISVVFQNAEVLDGHMGLTNISKETNSAEVFQPSTGVSLVGGDKYKDTLITNEAAEMLKACGNETIAMNLGGNEVMAESAGGNDVMTMSTVVGNCSEGDCSIELSWFDGGVLYEKPVYTEDGHGVGGSDVMVESAPLRNSPPADLQVLVDCASSSNFCSSGEHALDGQNVCEMPKAQRVLEISDNAGALVPYQSNKSRAIMKNNDSRQTLESPGSAGALIPYQSNMNKSGMKNKNLGRRWLHKGSTRLKPYQDSRSLDGGMLEDSGKALYAQAGCGVSARTLVKRTLQEFESLRKMLVKSQDGVVKDGIKRADLDAGGMMKERGEWRNCDDEKIVGEVPGVEVGDQFSFRMEMLIIGLHRQVQAGIDYIPASRRSNKTSLATSIVASGGYEDDKDDGNVLIYTGQGGKDNKGGQGSNQKLVRGNLALSNSMKEKSPVRVIRGTPDLTSPSSKVYTYDGLYDVVGLGFEHGTAGYQVFHFTLIRRQGQPQVGLSFLSTLKKKGIARPHLLLDDISRGQERLPVCVVNEVDEEPAPSNFVYIANIKYPMWYSPSVPRGCDCVGGCFNEENCSCANKNGGEFPYNENGYLIRDKNVVFECGSSCRCSCSCQNRVSQNGLRYRLEIFKTKNRGWGVRSLNSIQSGSFICEYTGELLSDAEAEERVGNDEYLFDLANHCNALGVLDEATGADGSSALVAAASDVAYTIDAKGMGNVARFINHSCSPNLYPQDVLYDSDDLRFPRVMLFAMEKIPPMRELTYDYNYSLGHIHDAHGNVKTKPCYCGAQDCRGRLY